MDDEKIINETTEEVATEPAEVVDTASETTEEAVAGDPKAIKNPDNPLEGASIEKIEQLLKNVQSIVQVMEERWRASERELDLKNHHIQELHKWNEEHKTPKSEETPEEEWDALNGLDSLTDEEIHRIFGDEHRIYGVDHSQTLDRIKGAMDDFMHWILAMREYNQIHDAYIQLLEMEEDKNIKILQAKADAEEDPERKKIFQDSIDLYYDNKLLGFLKNPLDEKFITRTVNALSDVKKVDYWIQRTREKLKQLKISSKFILEISQFEKRILEEKYWGNSNVFLLYFMQLCIYSNIGDKNDSDRLKVICIISAMDGIMRGTLQKDRREQVLNNIRAFEDQFLGLCPEPAKKEEITPPMVEDDNV